MENKQEEEQSGATKTRRQLEHEFEKLAEEVPWPFYDDNEATIRAVCMSASMGAKLIVTSVSSLAGLVVAAAKTSPFVCDALRTYLGWMLQARRCATYVKSKGLKLDFDAPSLVRNLPKIEGLDVTYADLLQLQIDELRGNGDSA